MVLINERSVSARIQITIPVPTKFLWQKYHQIIDTLAGEKNAKWEDFVSGISVSETSRKVALFFCGVVLTLAASYLFGKPDEFASFWTNFFVFSTFLRFISLAETRGHFLLLEFPYLASLLTLLACGPLKNNTSLWTTALGVQLSSSLFQFFGPNVSSLKLDLSGSSSTMLNLHRIFRDYFSIAALFTDMHRKKKHQPYIFQQVIDTKPGELLLPVFVFVGWQIGNLLITEFMFRKFVYKRSRSKPNAKTTLKDSLHYWKKDANNLYPRNVFINLLHQTNSLTDDDEFCPEKESKHHVLSLFWFGFLQALSSVGGVVFMTICLKVNAFFSVFLQSLFLILIWRGASQAVVSKETESSIERKVSSVSSSCSSDLNEGGDEPGETWEKDLFKTGTIKGGDSDKLQPLVRNVSVLEDTEEEALAKREEVAVPVPVKESGDDVAVAVEKDI